MKNIFKKILVILGIIGLTSLTTNILTNEKTFAAFEGRSGKDCELFLGLTTWDCDVNINSEESLKTDIWKIVANVATDITIVAAYLILGYVIYGGYQYTFSGGDPGKIAKGKKTLVNAFTGLAIVMSANLIMRIIRIVLVGGDISQCATGECTTPGALVTGLINWFTTMIGIVSAVFLVYGGISYITSSGDPGKVQKARQTIIYSLVGLAIVALAVAITAFVSNSITNVTTN